MASRSGVTGQIGTGVMEITPALGEIHTEGFPGAFALYYWKLVAQTYPFFGFVCASSPVDLISCLNVNIMVDVAMLRTAEEGILRPPPRYLLKLPTRITRK